jgi:hypothetical protein
VAFLHETGAPPERVRLYTEPQPRPTLRTDTPLYAVRDAAGLWLAFPREAEAAECLGPAVPAQSVTSLYFGELLERQPRALVHLHEQYYHAQDLA